MALLATRRIAPGAARMARRATVQPLQVHAFKTGDHKKPAEDEGEVTRREAPQAAVAWPAERQQLRVRSLFDEMEREMSQLSRAFGLSDAFSPFLSPFSRRGAVAADPFEALAGRAPDTAAMRLATDVHSDDKAYTITADVPGMAKEDVKVSLEDGVLTIRGEHKHEKTKETEGRVHWVERSRGSFVRAFSLPDDADADAVAASLKDGVMTVTIPKRPELAKPAAKEIPVETA